MYDLKWEEEDSGIMLAELDKSELVREIKGDISSMDNGQWHEVEDAEENLLRGVRSLKLEYL